MTIENIREHQLKDIAKIHFNSLPNDFLPLMGEKFLSDVFYKFSFLDENSHCLVDVKNGKCRGFLLLVSESGKFLKTFLINNFKKISVAFIKAALKNPEIIKFAFGLLSSLGKSEEEDNFAEIYIIAIDENARGKGIGDALVRESIRLAKSENSPGIKIKTLKSNNRWVNYFLKNKWRISREISINERCYVLLKRAF